MVYIANNRAAPDREYSSADRPKSQLLNDPLPVALPPSVRSVRAFKVALVLEVVSGQ